MAISQGSLILASDVSNICRIEAGDYQGVVDGDLITSQASTTFQKTLTFSFAPKIIFIGGRLRGSSAKVEAYRWTIFAGQKGGVIDDASASNVFTCSWSADQCSVTFTVVINSYNVYVSNYVLSTPIGIQTYQYYWVAFG